MRKRQNIRQMIRRGYCDIRLRAAVTGVLALVWWGILYPELSFTEATFQEILVTGEGEQIIGKTDCRDLLDAAGDQIVIRSRLLEWLEEQEWFAQGEKK
jgi:hypothetical protein